MMQGVVRGKGEFVVGQGGGEGGEDEGESPGRGWQSQMSAWAHCLGSSSGETGSQCQRRALGGLIRPDPPISCSISRGLTPPSACHSHSAGLADTAAASAQATEAGTTPQFTRHAVNTLVASLTDDKVLSQCE